MNKRFIQKVRRQDRIAGRAITLGGMLVIAAVIAIILLIIRVALPMFMPAKAQLAHRLPAVGADEQLAVGIDDYQEAAFVLDRQGRFTFTHPAAGTVITVIEAGGDQPPRLVQAIEPYRNDTFNLLWQDQSLTVARVVFTPRFDDAGKRTIVPEVAILKELPPPTLPATATRIASRGADGDRFLRVALLADNRFHLTLESTATDLFGNESRESAEFLIEEPMPGRITAFTLNEKGTILLAGTDQGRLLRWEISQEGARRTDEVAAVAGDQPITALALVFGGISVAVGGADGSLVTWMPIWEEQGGEKVRVLRPIHRLKSHQGAVAEIIPSRRSKSLLSRGDDGRLHLDHMTSENHLLSLAGEKEGLSAAAMSGRGNSLVGLDREGRLLVWQLDNPHPEISFKTLFGKVWYENYQQPEYVWQSSAGNDDFEPKLSIVPLLFGTIKGTFYAMLFAIPLAIFGAVYTSQLTSPAFRQAIKPGIEVMASVPSVVIGFLIALWLAPIVERHILALLMALCLVPTVFILFMALIKPLCERPTLQNRFKGYEFLLLVPVIIIGGMVAFLLAPPVDALFFQGDFKQWLYDGMGVRYDQRNSIIIAFGLGIAVIPIIFSITEDAISNIPPSLSAASLALGASRWQTIWRVVLPSASPGIFAAIMIGFGRAVGETMIVLMATGNTPIMDWSIFNGMRTLSANIAVEIPEAPVGGTLYRVLFLCATLLFSLTFILNTGAEIVRERLRKKYGRY